MTAEWRKRKCIFLMWDEINNAAALRRKCLTFNSIKYNENNTWTSWTSPISKGEGPLAGLHHILSHVTGFAAAEPCRINWFVVDETCKMWGAQSRLKFHYWVVLCGVCRRKRFRWMCKWIDFSDVWFVVIFHGKMSHIWNVWNFNVIQMDLYI